MDDGFGEVSDQGFGQARHLAAELGVEHELELLAPSDPGGYLGLDGFWRRSRRWIDRLAESREHLGVDLVGLREAARSAGKIADLAGIDDAEENSGFMERRDDGAFPASRRLANDVDAARNGEQPGEQFFTTLRIVAQMEGGAAEIEIEGFFGDIETDTDKGNGHGDG